MSNAGGLKIEKRKKGSKVNRIRPTATHWLMASGTKWATRGHTKNIVSPATVMQLKNEKSSRLRMAEAQVWQTGM
ncbi:MAG TPA: hypothetical protein DEF45_10205 [Rhodopirellula sp.]|nr:hypothetical protein [Rhodopirellula sp.]